MVTARPQVVIVGAGFGGLEAAMGLEKAALDVLVLDRQNHHCFQPLLYQVATAALSPGDIAWPIRGILRHQRNARVLLATVTGVNLAKRVVEAGDMRFPYDFLILATGATHSYFGHDEWAAVAPGLKHIDDATTIRRRLLLAFERAEATQEEATRRRLLTFVIVGGGATGVEMAGAIVEIAHHTLGADFRTFDPRTARVLLLEAGPRLLPAFPEALSAYATRSLERLKVEVGTATRVTGCDAEGVEIEAANGEKGRIEAETIIWAAGVVASPAGRWLGAETDRAGRVKVGPDLSLPGHPEIFVIGDTAAALRKDGGAVPGIAPAAKQMGTYVARAIAARTQGRPPPGPFRYRHKGDLATIGRKAAIVKLRRVQLRGLIGWLFWSAAHIYFLIGLRNRVAVAFKWAWDYLTLQRGVRLITGSSRSEP